MVRIVETLEQFEQLVEDTKSNGKLLVVDFTATWCGPCARIAPVFESLAEQHAETAIFVKVDVDVNQETAGKCAIRAMPTFMFFKGGAKVLEFSGGNEAKLRESLATLLKHQ